MFEISRKIHAILFKLSSEISLVPNVLDEAKEFLKLANVNDPTKVLLGVQELLRNAVVHGNKNDSNLLITCCIEQIDGGLFKIVVEDEGNGFDYRCLDFKIPEDPKNIQKRGYKLLYILSKKIHFAGKGNHVTAYMDVPINKVSGCRNNLNGSKIAEGT